VFSAHATTIGATSYANSVAYIAKADAASICFDGPVETTTSINVDAYSSTLHATDTLTSTSLGYSTSSNSLSVTVFANSPDADQPCEVEIEFVSDPADKSYF